MIYYLLYCLKGEKKIVIFCVARNFGGNLILRNGDFLYLRHDYFLRL